MSAGNGQGRRSQAIVPLPGTSRRAFQNTAADQAHMAGHHLADVTRLHQLLHVQHGRGRPRLKPDHGLQSLGPGQFSQFFGFVQGGPQRPLGVNVLPGVQYVPG